MSTIVFNGVSPRCLGDLLKGYGLIAVLGERYRQARFWWDDGFHLVAELPDIEDRSAESSEEVDERSMPPGIERAVVTALGGLPGWAENVAGEFGRSFQKSCDKPLPCPDHPSAKRKGKKKTCPEVLQEKTDSKLKLSKDHDRFDPTLAEIARSAALPRGEGDRNAEPHPWLAGYGQDGRGRGNYFDQLMDAASHARQAITDLQWSLLGSGDQPVERTIDKGYLFFPEPTKRYATGVAGWIAQKAAVTSWCFLLAIRGALLLRGSLRRPRWRRAGYPAFPFVFDGGDVAEVHLPTWTESRPRTLNELLMQVRQFHAPLAQASYAVTAAEFRAAVQRRGPAVGFDVFHRFVIEPRRPGQSSDQFLPQAIPRGLTRVGEKSGAVDLRRMIAPLGESGWVDQFKLPWNREKVNEREYAIERRSVLDGAIHRAIDEPGAHAYVHILKAVWELSRELLLPGKLHRAFEKSGVEARPAPPLPARDWERALADRLAAKPEWRLARALGSIFGVRATGERSVGPILEQLLPVSYSWGRQTWTAPKDKSKALASLWSDRLPLRDFQSLLWRRWLTSEGLPRLPLRGARTARLDDVLQLIRGELDIGEVHRVFPLFALLDWHNAGPINASTTPYQRRRLPIPAAYAAIRLWFDLGISPRGDATPPRDADIPRLLSLGGVAQVEQAVTRAFARLRIQGLPWDEEPAPTRKAVATASPRMTNTEAKLMALAVMVPISTNSTLTLSRRLWVAATEKEMYV